MVDQPMYWVSHLHLVHSVRQPYIGRPGGRVVTLERYYY